MRSLLTSKVLTHILYAEKPLTQFTTEDVVQTLSPTEFFEKFHIIYTESLLGDSEEIRYFIENTDLSPFAAGRPDTPTEVAVLERLENPLLGLVICRMQGVGYGLFTQYAIPRGTILFLYSGVLDDAQTNSTYDEHRDSDYHWLPTSSKVINAAQFGGLARFMQHLPLDMDKHAERFENDLKSHPKAAFYEQILKKQGKTFKSYVNELLAPYQVNDEVREIPFHDARVKQEMATSCVKLTTVVVQGIPVVICIAEEDIPENAQIGFTYGKQYWKDKQQKPRYFHTDGSLIPLSAYSDTVPTTQILTGIISPDPRQMYDSAVTAYKLKKYYDAINLLKAAINIYDKHAKHKELATCYDTLASCYRDLGDSQNAVDVCNRALLLRQQLLDMNPDNAEMITALNKTKNKLQQLSPEFK